jgi:hypothetical protein
MDKVKAPEIITIREFERNQNNPVLGQWYVSINLCKCKTPD